MLHKNLVAYIQSRPFLICNDNSSDNGIKKMNVVSSTIYDVNNSTEIQKSFMICVLPHKRFEKGNFI